MTEIYFRSWEDEWCGLIDYDDKWLCINAESKTDKNKCKKYFNRIVYAKWDECVVYGEWDDWKTPHFTHVADLGEEGIFYCIIIDINIPLGKWHYKIKLNNIWIEHSENQLREKDNNGNWNNVIFIHD